MHASVAVSSRRAAIFVCLSVCAALMAAARPASATTLHAGPFVYVKGTASVRAKNVGGSAGLCPTGTRATGIGGSIGGGGHSKLLQMEPIDTLVFGDGIADNGGVVQGYNAAKQKVGIASTLICMTDPSSDLTYVHHAEVNNTGLATTARSVSCPTGSGVVGGGAGIEATASSYLWESRPVTDTGWRWVTDFWETNSSRTLSGDAICLPAGMRSVQFVQADHWFEPGQTGRVKAACPKDYHVSAGGTSAGGSFVASAPYDGPDADSAPDDGWSTRIIDPKGFGENHATTFAICVQ